ncbi:hypothetical protein ACFQDN_21475 [Pseudomonas asuensis]|uniref:Uncharacterized protein n=1 Tax=Pseudomonas asuensis TaxID=1825787 RepID=A0ABQ2H1J2_9PSED|nr:hypothetical protein [Pseudomonas asuensis]GGM26021.1 hypothetical protein GCM10009425_40970 [Pseudomonas asuensis]
MANKSDAETRLNKTFRLRESYFMRLKEEALVQTRDKGSRVSESDIIDEALSDYWAKLDRKKS